MQVPPVAAADPSAASAELDARATEVRDHVEDSGYTLMIWREQQKCAFRHEIDDRREALSYREV